jgi:hypothetical protein
MPYVQDFPHALLLTHSRMRAASFFLRDSLLGIRDVRSTWEGVAAGVVFFCKNYDKMKRGIGSLRSGRHPLLERCAVKKTYSIYVLALQAAPTSPVALKSIVGISLYSHRAFSKRIKKRRIIPFDRHESLVGPGSA